MNIVVLNQSFETIYILDTYESLIWVDRYYEAGDFEIYTPFDAGLLTYLQDGNYIQIEDSDRTMIIEKIEVTSGVDNGTHLIVSGRSLESILTRRVIYPEATISGKLQTIVQTWLNETIINPTSATIGSQYYKLRKIDNFKFTPSTDTKVTGVTIPEETKNGEILYDVIQQYCQDNELGFRVLLNKDNEFVFELYAGADRSANQTDNDLVLFAKQYDNISSSDFYTDSKDFKNFVILVPGESAAVYYGNTTAKGLKHREHYHSCQAETQEEMDYYANIELYDKSRDISVTAEVDPYNTQFRYNEHYFLGDIVQMASEITEGQARVTEYTINVTESGKNCYPTFEFIPVYDEEDE